MINAKDIKQIDENTITYTNTTYNVGVTLHFKPIESFTPESLAKLKKNILDAAKIIATHT